MPRRIVIYGASGGIGSTTARILYSKGVELHLVGRTEETLAPLASELKAQYTLGDVCDESLFQKVSEDFQDPWDGLIYSVGTINLGSIRRLTAADFMHDFQVNAVGAALAVKGGLSALKKSKNTPSIVFFSSVAAIQGFVFHASIGMAKGAVGGLVLSLAAELAPKIRVNGIAPSLTRTPLAESILSNEDVASAVAEMHALKKLGTPHDVANLAAYLVSDEAGWVTGQIISIDGGRSTLRPNS